MGQDGGAICGALRQTESAAHEGRCGASQVQTGKVVGAGVRASPSDSSNADRSIQFRCVSVRFDAMERGRRKAKPRRGTQRASNASNSDNGSPAMRPPQKRGSRAKSPPGIIRRKLIYNQIFKLAIALLSLEFVDISENVLECGFYWHQAGALLGSGNTMQQSEFELQLPELRDSIPARDK
jgi:hypothetical protein